MYLTNEEYKALLQQDSTFEKSITLFIVRETGHNFFGMNEIWGVGADNADWTGFMDDYGTFVPVGHG